MSGWVDDAEAYDRSFALLCAGAITPILDLIEQREPAPGRRLLDAGTGTGRLAAAASDRGMRVDAVDTDPTMIRFAAARRGRASVSYRVASLLDLDIADDAIDVSVANFVINHTVDPRASLRELSRVTRTGGTIVVTIWPTGVTSLNAIWTATIDRSRAVRPTLPRLPPDLDFERSVGGLRALMTEATLVDVEVMETSWEFRIAPEELWLAASAGIALIGTVHAAQDEQTCDRMRHEFDAVTAPMLVDGGLRLTMTGVLAVGTA